MRTTTFRKLISGITAVLRVATLVLATATLASAALAQTSAPVELTSVLLDRWVAAMGYIGARDAAADPSKPLGAPDEAFLEQACTKAQFESYVECSCTSLYAAVLMIGFDAKAQRFSDPAIAAERKVRELAARTARSPADNAGLLRYGQILSALRQAFPAGVPATDMVVMERFFRDRMTKDAAAWRGLARGLAAFQSKALANQCPKPLPGFTRQARRP